MTQDTASPLLNPSRQVGCLWIGGALSFLEQLCLKSMRRHGAEVTLYVYQDVEGVPDGIRVADAASIARWDTRLVHRKTGSPALMSDLFRYHILRDRPGTVWCDTDVLFLQPLPAEEDHIFGFEAPGLVNGAVAGLPADAPALQALLAFCDDHHPVPPWADQATQSSLRGTPVHVSEQPWGVWGPAAFTHFLKASGGIEYAAAQEVYHPVAFRDVRDLIMRGRNMSRWLTDRTRTVHLYGRATRRIVAERFDGVPPWHGYLGRQLRAYDIDARAAPLGQSR